MYVWNFISINAWVFCILILLIYFAIIIVVVIGLGISKYNLCVAAIMSAHEKPSILGQWEVPKTICKSLQTQSSTFPVCQRINFDTNSQRHTTNYITFAHSHLDPGEVTPMFPYKKLTNLNPPFWWKFKLGVSKSVFFFWWK